MRKLYLPESAIRIATTTLNPPPDEIEVVCNSVEWLDGKPLFDTIEPVLVVMPYLGPL